VRLDGGVDFANNRGRLVVTFEGYSSDDDTPIDDSSQTLWIGSRTYQETTTPQFFMQTDKPWSMIDFDEAERLSPCIGPLSAPPLPGIGSRPDRVLADIAESGGTLDRAGTEVVRDVSTTRWSVMLGRPEHRDVPDGCDQQSSEDDSSRRESRYEVWVDEEGRARRIRFESRDAETDTTYVQTTDFFDFGAPVDVEAPPDDEVVDQTLDYVRMSRGFGTASNWDAVASGDTPVSWKLWYAKTNTGTRCYDAVVAETDRVPGDPPYVEVDPQTPKRDGRPAACLVFDPVVVVVDESDGFQREIVGGVDDGYDVAIHFSDGSTAEPDVEGDERVFSWAGSGEISVTKIVATHDDSFFECSLDESYGPPPSMTLGDIPVEIPPDLQAKVEHGETLTPEDVERLTGFLAPEDAEPIDILDTPTSVPEVVEDFEDSLWPCPVTSSALG
jgi:hypothetical protein